MKILSKFLLFILILICVKRAHADIFNPYIGAEVNTRHMKFKKDYGGNILKDKQPQHVFYVGIRPIKQFGIEFGYESTHSSYRIANLNKDDIVNGAPIPHVLSPLLFKSKIKTKGTFINMIGFHSPWNNIPLELFSSIGVSFKKFDFERQTLQANMMPIKSIRYASDRTPIFRTSIGAQYMLNKHLGTKLSLGLEKTNKIVIYANDDVCSKYIPCIQPKNSLIYGYGLGLFYKF